jgi:hypothetical protein
MVLLLNAAATWFMVGVIWFVQIVHYPLFGKVGEKSFVGYHRLHKIFIMWVITLPLAVEGMTTLLLLLQRPPAVSAVQVWLGAGLLAVIWASTAAIQVPKHYALSGGFDPRHFRFLVGTNWIRTVGWSLRGALTLWMISGTMG